MKEEKGYEILDAVSVCKEHDKEKKERLKRVEGMTEGYDEIDGFIPRNNVMERL